MDTNTDVVLGCIYKTLNQKLKYHKFFFMSVCPQFNVFEMVNA